jgi:hypothetical protein
MTQCSQCGRKVIVYARIARDSGDGFVPFCRRCATPIGAWQTQFIYQPRHVGPTPAAAIPCPCGSLAVAQCDTCQRGFCELCWWKHSHRRSAVIATQGKEYAQ